MRPHLTRRAFGAGAAALIPALAHGQEAPKPQLGRPLSVITNPPRDFSPRGAPVIAPDPDIIRIDRSFGDLLIGQETIRRIATGYTQAEGPAWNAQGQYLIFSDVKADTLYRYVWESGAITAFRKPSYGPNGNSFDFQGRQLSTQEYFRRLVRWEVDGYMTVLADAFEGKPFNSPNDLAPHKDGSVWFSDPLYGATMAGGHPDAGGPRDPGIGVGGVGLVGSQKQVLPANVYRRDPGGKVELVVPFAEGLGPNGLCFSPDYTKAYLVRGTGLWVGDVRGNRLSGLRLYTDCIVDGIACNPDGLRCDSAGNVWAGSASLLGYAGVTVWNPSGKLIGRIRLPENCANLCFAGPKRDWLVMTATQSLYILRVNIQGAAPG